VFSSSRYDRISPLLHQLHWLRAPERMQFRLAVLMYKCLRGTAPSYLADELKCMADFKALRTLSICFLAVAECLSYTAVHHRRSDLPCCCCPYLEQSVPTCYVLTLYVWFSRSPQGFPVQAFLPMTLPQLFHFSAT